MRFSFGGFGRQRFLFARPGLEELARVFQFFVEALFTSLTSLHLGTTRREALFEVGLVSS